MYNYYSSYGKKIFFCTILTVTILSTIFAFTVIYTFYQMRLRLFSDTQQEAHTKMAHATEQLAHLITMLEPLAITTARQLSNGEPSTDIIDNLLKRKPTQIAGLGVVFIQKNQQETQKVHYLVEHNDQQQEHTLTTEEYNYTQQEWYKNAMQGKSTFTGPIPDPVTQEPVIIFSTPIYRQTSSPQSIQGVVFACQSLAHLNHVLATLYTSHHNYWFITDTQGTFLLHPTKQLVAAKKNIQTIMPSALSLFTLLATEHDVLSIETIGYTNPFTHAAAWLSGTRIPDAHLLLFSVADVHDMFTYNDIARKKLMLIVSVLLCVIVGIIALCAFSAIHKASLLWSYSGFASLALTTALCLLWAITAAYPDYQESSIPVKNKVDLYQFLDSLSTTKNAASDTTHTSDYYLRYRYKKGRYVPTGILIQDVNFLSKDQVEFVGIIWQRYFAGIHDAVSRGFTIQLLTGKPDIKQISKTVIDNQETYVWLVHAKLNQTINYYKFPFDVKDIKIQLAHKDFDKNIILVPDLDAYALLNPLLLPGINSHAHLSGWQLRGSYFAYDIVQYNTTFGMYTYGPFGISDQIDKSHTPELQFIIEAKRNLFDTLTTDLITLIIIALLLFLLLLTYRKQEFSSILTTFATILFSNIVAQQYFKSKIPSDEFVYFEFFHFLMYIAILLVMILALLDIFACNIPFVRYKNNFIAALLYWPCLLSALVAITLLYLY